MMEPVHIYIGKIREDCFWIQRPDGRFFQVNEETKNVLEELAGQKPLSLIAEESGIGEEEILYLLQTLGITPQTNFLLVQESREETGPVIRKWGFWLLSIGIGISFCFIFAFTKNTPFNYVTSLKDLWLVAGFLTLSVMIHELGHFLAMPSSKKISISVQWSGPVPLLSIIHNEAWKLGKWKRVWIHGAGFVADLLVLGFVSLIGFFFPDLSPWVWSFFVVHLIRMVFSIFPLLPGDGYWILVDLSGKPNLWAHSVAQLKQLKANWLSLYALLRILFMASLWFVYAYLLFLWLGAFLHTPVKEGIIYLLHPAPLLLLLNLSYQMYTVILWGFHRVRQIVKNPGPFS